MAALRERELCGCQLIELLGLAPSTVSKHMSILKHAGLVDCRKSGRWMYYRWPEEDVTVTTRKTLGWLEDMIKNQSTLKKDAKHLRAILRIDPEELCKRQTKS